MTGRHPRTTVSLDGEWEFVTDPDEMGMDAEWFTTDASWPGRARTVSVPHAWQEHDALHDYTGTAWYRRTLSIKADELDDREVFIRFGAVDYKATVWVNGERLGRNQGGYLPFEFDVTDALNGGENQVVVAVTDPADLSEIPHGKQGDPWYTRVSGIWQSATLEVRPRIRVTDAKVIPDLTTDTADVDLNVELGDADPAAVECTVEARLDSDVVASKRVELPGSTDVLLEFSDPTYWSPEDPALYELVVRLERDDTLVDEYTDTFGLRSFEVVDGEFRLNGEPFTMRGVLEQGYYPETLYRPPTSETFAHEVRIAKDLGFNLIRKHIKPAHPEFLAEADRQGILVWEEPANPTRFTERAKQAVVDQLHGLIERDYNRPSVVVWSLYNEEWGIGHADGEETLWTDVEKQEFLADLYRDTRERDVTRVVCDNSGWAHVATDVNDFHRYFISPDRAAEWEADLDHICHHPGDNYATVEFDETDAPIVISELGAWGLGDVDALREAYDGDPPWFGHDFLTNPVKRPEGFDARFTDTNLADVFETHEALATAWQWREFVAVKHVLEAVRTRSSLDGYVLTELSDIEWEFNGILDYHRQEKAFHDDFAAVNRAVSVVASPDSHVGWAGDEFAVPVTVVNDTTDPVTGTLEWTFGEQSGAQPVSVPPSTSSVVTTLELPFPTPGGAITTEPLGLEFETDAVAVNPTSTEPITAGRAGATEMPPVTVYAEGAFASRLARAGVDVTHELSSAVDVAFTDQITSAIDQFATQGGAVVHIPTTDGEMANGGPFTYHEIPREESWLGATSLYYQDSVLLEDICGGPRLGWEFEGLYPYAAATNLNQPVDRVHVGYVEGWLANWSSPLIVRGYGSGSMTAFTFRIRSTYGDHPVATILCNRLVEWLTS